ncbi:restriction endonuclease subunit S [Rosistilla oblonga]|uniref:EcoKI restriction-modification system protein HsdS n=1 Tax=Rosistilla oblonga TaxID=2527990 RepID=A0A518IT45_9BACT|nr:restriction endonuclease subunit S [Rosistilla oblonga]QDV56257.1 EcoKI restriction-modification system protein HsdS [Rosistilla oblonga]
MNDRVSGYDVEIPAEWTLERVRDLTSRVGSGITPRGGSDVYQTEGVLFIRSQNVRFEGLNLSDVAYIDRKTHRSMDGSKAMPFDVLLNITGASIGRCCVLPSGLGDVNVNQHVCTVRLEQVTQQDAEFLSSALASPIGQNQIFRLNAGGNREGLNYEQLRAIEVPWPRPNERRKIARILTTVDNLIEKTEALIAKYQAIKQGMMHDLFTRGVDSSGQLRPTQQQAPDLYKQSELGWIPKEWDEDTLGNICTWMSGGTPSKSNESFWRGTIPWVSPKDMKVFEISDSEDHISEEAARVGTRRVPAGTVLIVIRGMILAHSFPVAITTRDVTFNQDMKSLCFDDAETGRFVAHWFVAHRAKMVALATASSHGTKRFDLADVYSIPIGMPTKTERKRIVERIDSLDSNRKAEEQYLSKLRTQKSGLMQDLLTGRVRVKVDETEEVAAHA